MIRSWTESKWRDSFSSCSFLDVLFINKIYRPDLTVKKRRGGRKMRQLKERFEETALMKQANTRAFSAQTGEYGDDAMGLTMGLLDTAQGDGNGGGSGNVRKQVAEKRKMRQTNTKATRKRAAQMARTASASNNNGASAMISGLASAISFTPMQAMELVNPDAQKDRVRQANLKWFSDSAGFQSAVPPKK
jgi:U4/U6 small nuclear ribonucleoprotein PRP31